VLASLQGELARHLDDGCLVRRVGQRREDLEAEGSVQGGHVHDHAGPGATVLAELAGLIADGHLEVPIANVYPLAQVREAYTELERRHTRGKIVLRP
jgi:NADPH:quinone reductase-like Zn-dependent oxidoreductase